MKIKKNSYSSFVRNLSKTFDLDSDTIQKSPEEQLMLIDDTNWFQNADKKQLNKDRSSVNILTSEQSNLTRWNQQSNQQNQRNQSTNYLQNFSRSSSGIVWVLQRHIEAPEISRNEHISSDSSELFRFWRARCS